MSGCCDKSELQIWVATASMPVYRDYKNDAQIIAFNLQSDDICLPGKEQIEKVYKYTEVLCHNKGYGWVADTNFKVINKNNINIKH